MANILGLASTLRPRGRPRLEKKSSLSPLIWFESYLTLWSPGGSFKNEHAISSHEHATLALRMSGIIAAQRRDGKSSRAALMYADVATARRYTLVVGAGINVNRNIPGWAALVARARREVFGHDADYRGNLTTRLAEARAAVQEHCCWTREDAQRLDIAIHPLEPQFALELIDLHLRQDTNAADDVRRLVTETPPRVSMVSDKSRNLLPVLLARCLYEHVARNGRPDTPSELARSSDAANALSA